MAFGFVIERFGIFLQIVRKEEMAAFQRHLSFFIGESFVLLAVFIAIYSILQYKRVIRTLRPIEIPEGYNFSAGIIVNAIIGGLGVILSIYLAQSFI